MPVSHSGVDTQGEKGPGPVQHAGERVRASLKPFAPIHYESARPSSNENESQRGDGVGCWNSKPDRMRGGRGWWWGVAAIRVNMRERQAGTASGLYRSSGRIDTGDSGHAEGGAQKPRHARAEKPANMSQASSPRRRSGGYHRFHRRGHRRQKPTLSRPDQLPEAAPRCSSCCAAPQRKTAPRGSLSPDLKGKEKRNRQKQSGTRQTAANSRSVRSAKVNSMKMGEIDF